MTLSKKVFVKSYGCQMNVYDSARMAEILAPLGYQPADSPDAADLIILNTCHIREKAAEKVYSELGRLAQMKRQKPGMLVAVALMLPFGIGPLQFPKFFPEDPHNSYLNAFMSGGWLAGVCYPTLVLVSLYYGMRAVFTPTPWQRTTIVIYTAYFTTAAESAIIDSDHWRHGFLILGVLWGLIAASQAYASAGFSGRKPALAHQHPPS